MRNENTSDRLRLKSIMWELVLLKFLEHNGFKEITYVDNVKTRRQREQFFEMRGRGCWHQIDCPCDYDKFIPFINPIRLIAEVKYYAKPIKKEHIRQFVGVLKDVQENYVTSDHGDAPTDRFTELGAFFSSSGFDKEAEKLAFAHNIKTVSHRHVWLLEPLKDSLEELESNYLSAKECVSEGVQTNFVRAFKSCLRGDRNSIKEFRHQFKPADGFDIIINNIIYNFRAVKSSFVATTSGGALIHFVGEKKFPDYLFHKTDKQLTRVFYFSDNNRRYFYLTFSADRFQKKYFFNPPVALDRAAFYSNKAARDEKRKFFRSIHVTRQISGLSRNLLLQLDNDWLDAVEDRDG